MDDATVVASVDEDNVVADIDDVAGADAEADAVVPVRSDDAFFISNYCLQTTPLLVDKTSKDQPILG